MSGINVDQNRRSASVVLETKPRTKEGEVLRNVDRARIVGVGKARRRIIIYIRTNGNKFDRDGYGLFRVRRTAGRRRIDYKTVPRGAFYVTGNNRNHSEQCAYYLTFGWGEPGRDRRVISTILYSTRVVYGRLKKYISILIGEQT